jgi:hypothetical protein
MDITITITNQQGTRVLTALGHKYGLKDGLGSPRDATAQEAKDFIVRHLKQTVLEQERQDAFANAVIADF